MNKATASAHAKLINEIAQYKITALRAVADKQISMNGRNYYLSEAAETKDALQQATQQLTASKPAKGTLCFCIATFSCSSHCLLV